MPGRSVIWISVAIAEELENIHEHVHEIQIQIQCAKDGTFLTISGSWAEVLFKHRAGGLGVVDGHAGEEQKSDGRDDHEGGVAGGEDHENHFGDDKHDEADEKDGAGLEHVDLGGASEHGEREEEAAHNAREMPMVPRS